MLKIFFDIVLSCFALLVTSPIALLAALLIRLDSPGPVVFKQRRAGKNGKPFEIYKFRTMVEDAEQLGPLITAKNDTRVTQIGRILRWLKIDELPQFLNVIKGDMSIVGPRPEVLPIVEKYTEEEKRILTVKPGIIGPSQIKNQDEESRMIEGEEAQDFYIKKILPEKLKTDLVYVRNKDPFKDLKILLGGSASLILNLLKFRYIFESRRRLIFLFLDLTMAVLTYWAAFALRYEGNIPFQERQLLLTMLPFIVLLKAPCFIYFGLYQTLWQYLGTQELLAIIKAASAGSLLVPFVPFLLQIEFPPRSVLIIDWLVLMFALGASRIIFKLSAERLRKPRLDEKRKNVLLIGAEDSAESLVREFIKQPSLGYRPVGILDDDPQKAGVRIHGVKVMGRVSQLPQVVKLKNVDEIIIALPQSSAHQMSEIIKSCRNLKLMCRIIPQTSSLISPRILPSKLRPVDISDLLGRDLVQADVAGIQEFFREKKVLITGAGGSIGSELARILFQNHPKELVLIDNSESNLYDIETDLKDKPSETLVHSYLRDVTERHEIETIMERHKPHVVYHAAAYKHVPMMEIHYKEGIFTNLVGTRNMADLANQYGVETFVLISTDKAICPRSIMGTTKRICELYTQSLKGKARFLSVRFGNVFNSRGSVVPLFKKQIEAGGPITITHPNVTRYFMDISEAVFLILQATIMGSDSEIFVLDMGEPVKIVDLAKNLIQLAGLLVSDIPIKFTGLRPGEKLEEELELQSEKSIPTAHKKIKIWRSSQSTNSISKEIEELLELLVRNASRDVIVQKLKAIVPEYQPFEFQHFLKPK